MHTHLDALQLRLSNERQRLAAAKTPFELAARQAIVQSCEREIAGERRFLGLQGAAPVMSDDDLLASLGAASS